MLKAKADLERAVALSPNFAPARAMLSRALFQLGFEIKAEEEAKKAMSLSAGSTGEDALLVKGEFHSRANDWPKAPRTFQTLHSLFPENDDYSISFALALARNGGQAEALRVIESARAAQELPSPQLDLAEAKIEEFAGSYRRELSAAQRAEAEAAHVGLRYLVGRAKLSEAWALDNLAKLPDAEQKARQAQKVLAGLGDVGGEGIAWKDLGDVYTDQQKLQESTAAYEHAIANFQKIGSRSGQTVALNNLGYVLRDSGDFLGAAARFEDSLRVAKQMRDLHRQGMALNGIAITLKRTGNLSGAEEANNAALKIHRQLHEDGSTATALNDLAIVLQDEGKLSEAEEDLREAARIFQRLNRPIDVAMVYGNLGDLALRKGDTENARRNYKVQERMGRQIPQQKQQAYGLFELGEIAFLRCDFATAAKLLEESLRLRIVMRDSGTQAESRLALARIFVQEGRFADAASDSRAAANEFENERQTDQQAVAEAILAQALLEERQMDESHAAAESAIRLISSSEDIDSVMTGKLILWKVLDNYGRRTEALQMLQSVLDEAKGCRYLPQLLESEADLARLNLQAGNRSAEHELKKIRCDAMSHGLVLIAQEAWPAKSPASLVRAQN